MLKENTMDNILGYWNKKKEKLKQQYQDITDDDLTFYEGKEKEMIENLSYKLGKTREEMVDIISAL
jgi:uncharacterized protein YjbJ (UPF0337 family)